MPTPTQVTIIQISTQVQILTIMQTTPILIPAQTLIMEIKPTQTTIQAIHHHLKFQMQEMQTRIIIY